MCKCTTYLWTNRQTSNSSLSVLVLDILDLWRQGEILHNDRTSHIHTHTWCLLTHIKTPSSHLTIQCFWELHGLIVFCSTRHSFKETEEYLRVPPCQDKMSDQRAQMSDHKYFARTWSMTDCYLHHCTTHNEHIRYCTTHSEHSLNREIFATNNIRVFLRLTPLANISM